MSETFAAKSVLSAIQADIGEWSARNFGVTTLKGDLRGLLLLAQHVGTIAHAMLKHSQGIRGTSAAHISTMSKEMDIFRDNLAKFAYWSDKENADFFLQAAPFLGAIEEIGEMIEAFFDPDMPAVERRAKIVDGYADLLVFWLDFGFRNGFDAEASLNAVWEKVRQRDWKKDKVSGGETS
jgi:hypothetical protein